MDFGTRHLLRHRKVYRSMDLPFGIARLWSNIEKVSFEYVESGDEVIVRPVRDTSSTATTKAKSAEIASAHFSL